MNVGALDLLVLLAYVALVVGLGSWLGRGVRGATDYMLGSRDLPWWVILVSIVATETSTVTFLSIPGFAFQNDMSWLQIPLGFALGRLLVVWLLLPQYFEGQIFTSYEVLHQRFGGLTRRIASATFILTRSLADGLRLFLSAIVLQEMTGLALHWSVATIGLLTIVYTLLGGMRAVLWTDLIQFVVYMAGGVVALGLILHRLPRGWEQVVEVGGTAGKLRIFDLTMDFTLAYGLWAGLIGGAFVSLASHGVDQLMVQRYLCARGQRDAGRALGWSGFVVFLQFALFLFLGVALYVFYQQFPPEAAFDRPDRVFARFILEQMPTGLLGLLLGAVLAAAMSTLSSSLNSCATAAVNDLYAPAVGARATPERRLRLTRILTAAFGLVQIGVGIAGQLLVASVVSSILGVVSFTTGIVLGVFFLGLFAARVGQRAALSGLLFGLVFMTWIFFGTSLAWPWYALVGSASTFAAGLVASYALREPASEHAT